MIVPANKRHTVLLVDDTPANLSLLSNLLKEQYRIKVANNGAKALELAAAAPPDLVLLDIMMPEMDGYEVCRRLKAAEATHLVPVIFLTAKTEVADEELGFAVGAVDFIHKPISPPIVMARVKTHLQVKAWQDLLPRIMAFSDVFDALMTTRPYKTSMPLEKADAIIMEGSGMHFDPQLVEAFLAIQDDLQRISALWTDA